MTTNPAHAACSSSVDSSNSSISSENMMTTMIGAQTSGRPQQQQQRQQLLRLKKQRRGGRLWQLPQTSIQEYAQWIQTKPLSDQSIAEQKFLWKYQRRLLVRRNKLPTERMRDYIGRLEQKQDKSADEVQLVQQFHRRAARRKERLRTRGVAVPPNVRTRGPVGPPPPIFWRRNSKSNASQQQPQLTAPQQQQQGGAAAVTSGVLNMATLRESMGKLGLSAGKLREVPMEDAN